MPFDLAHSPEAVARAFSGRRRPSRQAWPPVLSQEIADAIAERERRFWWWGSKSAFFARPAPLPPSAEAYASALIRRGRREDAARRRPGRRIGLAAAACLLSLAGCTDANTSPGAKSNDGIRRQIWTDPETGCQYHFWESGSLQYYSMALSPRIAADRLPVCGTGRNG